MVEIICEYCNKSFTRKTILRKHQQTAKFCLQIQNKSVTLPQCKYCHKEFSRADNVVRHEQSFCPERPIDSQEDIAPTTMTSVTAVQKNLRLYKLHMKKIAAGQKEFLEKMREIFATNQEEFNIAMQQFCNIHPHNKWISRNGVCSCCFKAQSLANGAKSSDKQYNRICTDPSGPITATFINSLQGELCDICLEPCYVIYTPDTTGDPMCLSAGRRLTGIAHDCNKTHIVAQHLICNLTKHALTDKEMEERIIIAGKNNCQIDLTLPNAIAPNHKRGGQNFLVHLLSLKKSHALKKGLAFDLTLEWLIKQYEQVQKGLCIGCTAPLGVDISFDRIYYDLHYTTTNVQLMHKGCNCGKRQWKLSVLHDMFRRAYKNRQQ